MEELGNPPSCHCEGRVQWQHHSLSEVRRNHTRTTGQEPTHSYRRDHSSDMTIVCLLVSACMMHKLVCMHSACVCVCVCLHERAPALISSSLIQEVMEPPFSSVVSSLCECGNTPCHSDRTVFI